MSRYLVLLVLALGIPSSVSIKVSSPVVMQGNAVRVTCSVRRDSENRSIRIALEPYRASTNPLEGENSAVTHQVTFDHVPCDVDEATCTLETSTHRQFRAVQPILVGGCDAH